MGRKLCHLSSFGDEKVEAAGHEGQGDDQTLSALSDEELTPALKDRMQEHIQALLVAADLATRTVGQLRGDLEQRLGLHAGALDSKRCRKEVNKTLQIEIERKTQRSADCERVLQALVEFEEYPRLTRQMLIETLPYALSSEHGGLHVHQKEVLNIVLSVVSSAQETAMQKLEVRKTYVQEVKDELRACDEASKDLSQIARAISAEMDAKKAVLYDAQIGLQDAQAECADTERRLLELFVTKAFLEREALDSKQMSDGPLQMLINGTWIMKQEADESLKAVKFFMEHIDVEEALMAALPAALRRKPHERSTFGTMVATSVLEAVDEWANAIHVKLKAAEGAEHEAQVSLLAANATRSASQERMVDIQYELATAEARLAETLALQTAREAQHNNATILFKRRVSEQQLAECKMQELHETFSIIEQVIAGTRNLTKHADPELDALSGKESRGTEFIADLQGPSIDSQTTKEYQIQEDADHASKSPTNLSGASQVVEDKSQLCSPSASKVAEDKSQLCSPLASKVERAACTPELGRTAVEEQQAAVEEQQAPASGCLKRKGSPTSVGSRTTRSRSVASPMRYQMIHASSFDS